MQLNDIIDIISALVKVRKLFWSEDDFKFAFATQLQFKFGNKADVRLEKRYDRDGKSSYTDTMHWSDYSESGTEPMFRYQVAVIERH